VLTEPINSKMVTRKLFEHLADSPLKRRSPGREERRAQTDPLAVDCVKDARAKANRGDWMRPRRSDPNSRTEN